MGSALSLWADTEEEGEDMEKAKVVTFWSRKYTATQQNYTVHELELLAIVELLKCFQSYLIGTHFCVCTNHHSLKHFLTQKTLSSRQVRWLNVLSKFDFSIEYIAGKTNILADALSHIYSDKPPGVVQAETEMLIDKGDDIVLNERSRESF